MELDQRIGDRRGEGIVAFSLGHAYKNIPALRDLDQAEHWYKRDLELVEEHDTLGRARSIGQLGNLAYERFRDAQAAGAPRKQLLGYLNDAAEAFTQALALFPDEAVGDLAVTHHGPGQHLQRYRRLPVARWGTTSRPSSTPSEQDNRYRAGGTRIRAAITLMEAGRRHDALLYARAALRDFEAVGPGAASFADQARQLIAELEQEPADEHQSTTDYSHLTRSRYTSASCRG